MNGVVAGQTADNRALEAAFGVRRAGGRDDSDTYRSDFEESSCASHEKASNCLEPTLDSQHGSAAATALRMRCFPSAEPERRASPPGR